MPSWWWKCTAGACKALDPSLDLLVRQMRGRAMTCPEEYVCPGSGETECLCHGGFDNCCDHPDCPGNLDDRSD